MCNNMDHIPTIDLERQFLGQTTDTAANARINQHLSVCRECADRMLAIDRFIRSVIAGMIRAGPKSYDHFFIKERPHE
jgi:hypothetical protein